VCNMELYTAMPAALGSAAGMAVDNSFLWSIGLGSIPPRFSNTGGSKYMLC